MPSKKTSKSSPKKSKKLTPTEKLKNTIEQLEISLNESSEKHLRLKAEFDNFRKRKDKEIVSLLNYEGESVIMMDTIPIKDETTMKIMKSYEHGDFDRVKYEAVKNGKTYYTGVNIDLKGCDKFRRWFCFWDCSIICISTINITAMSSCG